MVQVGDRVSVETEKVGRKPRTGVVKAVQGSLISVQWESGEESMFVPASGSLRVVGHQEDKPKKRR